MDALVSHLLLLWAKLGQADFAERHPVICHLLDVASVALRLWEDALREALKNRLADSLGLPPDHAGPWLAFWAGAHAIGKVASCSPPTGWMSQTCSGPLAVHARGTLHAEKYFAGLLLQPFGPSPRTTGGCEPC
jgi:hypothetical protein